MNEAIILHSVSDAEDCVKKKSYPGRLLFSTHSSVDTYLKEKYNIECLSLSSFFSYKELSEDKNLSSQRVDVLLASLDSKIAPSLNKRYSFNMRFFWPLYSYIAKYHFLAYVYFVKALKKIINEYSLHKIFLYDYRFNCYLNTTSNMDSFRNIFFDDFSIEVLKFRNYFNHNTLEIMKFAAIAGKIIHRPIHTITNKVSENVFNKKFTRFSDKKKTILLYESLFELDFLKKALFKEYNVLYYDYNSNVPLGFKQTMPVDNINIDCREFDLETDKDSAFEKIFLHDVKEDFISNIVSYISSIIFLKQVHNRYPISLGIWGNSPMLKLKALIFEYLMSEGIRVLGSQHGGGCGDFFEPWHFESDFDRCNLYISYGFTESDLGRLYPNKKTICEIAPLGKVKLVANNGLKRKIDILFPLTLSFSMLEVGLIRITPLELTKRQIILLEYLDSLKGLDIYIKPYPYSTHYNCSVLPILKRLKNVKVIRDRDLLEFLQIYDPRIILIEFPSQPLYESLSTGAQIFLMNDNLHPFESQAFSKLEKRVHYAESTDEIIKKLDSFLKGRLPEKKDTDFYNYYIYKDNTEDNILRLVDSLV